MTINSTPNLGFGNPTDGDTAWGPAMRGNFDKLDFILRNYQFAERAAAHTGLTFGYYGGTIVSDNKVAALADGTILLTDNATNYIEVYIDASNVGQIVANTTGFTSGRMPLFKVITATGTISTVTDYRTWVNLGKYPSNPRSWVKHWSGTTGQSTTVFATKGSLLEPTLDVVVHQICCATSELATQTLALRIYQLNGTTQVGGALVDSGNITGPGRIQYVEYKLPTPLTLVAGNRYALSLSNTTAAATTVKPNYPANAGSYPYEKITGLNGYARITDQNPLSGATWEVFVDGIPFATIMLIDV